MTGPGLVRAAALALVAVLAVAACERPAPRDPTDPGDPTATGPPGGEAPATDEAGPPPAPTPPADVEPGTLPPELAGLRLPSLDRPAGRASGGLTPEPCPVPVNPGNGCLYLGSLEDLGRGPHGAAGLAATAAREAFWRRVNEAGGIGGYDVDATTYVRDTGTDPQAHVDAFAAVAGEVLALAATRGTTATSGLLPLLHDTGMAAVAAVPLSGWAATPNVVTVGSTACADAANAADHALAEGGGGVAVVAVPGAFGADATAGAALAADRHGVAFTALEVPAGDGAPGTGPAVAAVLEAAPSVVVVATGAQALEAVASGLVAQGYAGTVVALAGSWDERIAARLPPAVAARLRVVGPWAPWGTATPGHAALRAGLADALADGAEPAEAHVAAWASQYPLAAALEAAADAPDLTPAGVRRALAALEDVPGERMLPAGEAAEFQSVISRVDPAAPTGLVAATPHEAGATAQRLTPSPGVCRF